MQSDGSCYPIKQTTRIIMILIILDGKFVFQKNKDGTFNKTKVICTLCGKTFSFHRSKCVGRRGEFKWNAPNHPHLTVSKSACDKLTSTVAKWIAKSCRPINIVEDEGFTEVLRA